MSTTFLLIVHGLLAVALLGAVTHQTVSVWLPMHKTANSFVGRVRAVQAASYATAIIVLYLATATLGGIIYPAYRLGFRVVIEQLQIWSKRSSGSNLSKRDRAKEEENRMRPAFRRLGFAAAATLGLILALYSPAWSGGSSDEEPHDHDDGPRYFGFVKDASGKIVPDAKVTAEIKGRGTVITRSDKVGTYKLPGFGKDIDPKNVIVSCSKDGYKQIRTFRRPPTGKGPVTAIETECTMQRVGTK